MYQKEGTICFCNNPGCCTMCICLVLWILQPSVDLIMQLKDCTCQYYDRVCCINNFYNLGYMELVRKDELLLAELAQ